MTQHATPLERRDCGPEPRPAFMTRGVVLVPEDLTLYDWPERAQRAGLTTIALHHGSSPTAVVRAVQSDAGQAPRKMSPARATGGVRIARHEGAVAA